MEGLTDSQTEIKSLLKRFEKKLDTFSNTSEGETSPESIKGELVNFKSELYENLVEFFNQISFSTEAEDIKDFDNE